MAWFLELKWHGKDVYPLLREKFKDPDRRSMFHTSGSDQRPEFLERFNLVGGKGTSGPREDIEKRRRKRDEEMIVGTEIGITHRLRKENPGKKFIPASEQAVCPRMKLITLERVLWSLQEMTTQVKVPEEIRLKAKVAVHKML